jgi:pimeloyl-ACP methyl ester carboxylesterase
VAVLTAVNLDRVIIAGHSMGGLVALDVARQLPERVIGILAIDTLHDANAKFDEAELEQLLLSFEQDFVGTCDGFVRSMCVDGTAPELIDRIAGDMCSGPAEVGAALLRAYAAFDLQAAFSEANVPIRAINADLWPTNSEGNRQLADFDVVVMEGYGHFLMQEVPEALGQSMIDATLALVGGGDSSQSTIDS